MVVLRCSREERVVARRKSGRTRMEPIPAVGAASVLRSPVSSGAPSRSSSGAASSAGISSGSV